MAVKDIPYDLVRGQRPRQREARGPRDARGGPRGRLQQEARPGLQLLRRRGLQGAGEPREQEFPRRRAQPAVAHRHHRVRAPGRREGLPEPGHRLLRRDACRLVDWAAPRQAPRELEPAQGLRGEAGGGAHDDPLGPGRPLPLAGVDRDLRGERPGQEHVREGLQPGQLGLRGLLRARQERVLPLQGLGGRDGRGIHGEARGLPRVLSGWAHQEVPRVAEPYGVPQEAWIRLGAVQEIVCTPLRMLSLCFDLRPYGLRGPIYM